jgi:hypothetical protein
MSARDLTAVFDGATCRICSAATDQDREAHAAIHLAECTAIVCCQDGLERVVPNGADDPVAEGLTDAVDADVAKRAVAEAYARKHRGIRIPKGMRVFRP